MKNTVAILSAALMFAWTGCKKERLPKPSNRGRNIVAWRTDGEAYIAKGPGNILTPAASFTLDGDSILRIHGVASTGNNITVGCGFTGLNTPLPTRAHFPTNTTLSWGCGAASLDCIYSTKNQYEGTVTVTYFDGNIIAGTFQATVANDAGEVRYITDGQFDIKSD